MIEIDRSSPHSVQDQLVSQLRYLIAGGKYQVGEAIPSTRSLAEQTGVSFHTVRKAYQQLEEEGLLISRAGSGYIVRQRVPLNKSEQVERGAATVYSALRQLIGLGLEGHEIEYLLQEQLSLLESAHESRKIVFVEQCQEMAEVCAEQVSKFLQVSVEGIAIDQIDLHLDAEYAFTPFPLVKRLMTTLSRTEVTGVAVYYSPETFDRIARLLSHQTVGLIVRSVEAITHITETIRIQTGFTGQMIALPVDEIGRQLPQLIDQTDLIVYTPVTRRRLYHHFEGNHAHALLSPVVAGDSLDMIRRSIPR